MFNPFGKLLCVAALASAVLAQNITIVLPAEGTQVRGGTSLTVELERDALPADSVEVAVVIGIISCGGGCPDPTQALGDIGNSGHFMPQFTNGPGQPSQNFTVTVPNWFNGPAQLAIAHIFLLGPYGKLQSQFAATNLMVDNIGGG